MSTGVGYFIMKALTYDGKWEKFCMKDCPCMFDEESFALLRRPNSPVLRLSTLRRGDSDTGLFEGDIIWMENESWLVSYERGFKLTSESYRIKSFKSLSEYHLTGSTISRDFPVPMNYKKKIVSKYNDMFFKIQDIVGATEEYFLVKLGCGCVPLDEIHMDCCMNADGQHLYLGEKFKGHTIALHYGQVCTRDDKGQYTAITTGG